MASWLVVARTPLNEAAWLAGTPELARWARMSNPVPCAAPARTSSTVACQGHAVVLVSQARRPVAAAKTENAACGSHGCQAAGSLAQVTDARANPAAYATKVSPEASGLSPSACWR